MQGHANPISEVAPTHPQDPEFSNIIHGPGLEIGVCGAQSVPIERLRHELSVGGVTGSIVREAVGSDFGS